MSPAAADDRERAKRRGDDAGRPERDDGPGSAAEDRAAFGETVRRKADRRARARRERRHGVWFGLGMFGLVGWAVAVPTLIGIAIGAWLDGRFPGGPSWTLTGLVVGVALGALNAWLWVQRESRHD
jgi:ATP synthase protein I